MPDFKGKNNIPSTARLAFERAQYNLNAFPSNQGLGPPQVVNFNFAERTLYGKVDRQHNPVVPDVQYIVPLQQSNNSENVIQVMNFVATQFDSFQAHYIRACRMNFIPDGDPILSIIEARRGYEDCMVGYRKYARGIFNLYIKDFLFPNIENIKSFKDFIMSFPEFMNQMEQTFPITLSGYQRSTHSSIFSSGLAIDIGEIRFGDDSQKQDLMLSNSSFVFYLNLARQYGFSVDKHNPAVLISDLAGPATSVIRSDYGLDTVDAVFSNQYKKALYSDLDELVYFLLQYYNMFVDMSPVRREVSICNDKVLVKPYDRDYVTQLKPSLDNIILYLYITIRNIEERKPYNKIELDNFYNTSLRLQKLSNVMMLDYIDDRFKNKYTQKNGSLTSVLRKEKKNT